MIASNWKLTYDPAGTPWVMVDYGDIIDDEIQPSADLKVEVVDLVDGDVPFLRLGKNAAGSFTVKKYTKEATDMEARAAILNSLIAAMVATKKPLRIEVFGYTDRYWQFATATIKSHKPYRHLPSAAARWVTTWDIVATGFTYTHP